MEKWNADFPQGAPGCENGSQFLLKKNTDLPVLKIS